MDSQNTRRGRYRYGSHWTGTIDSIAFRPLVEALHLADLISSHGYVRLLSRLSYKNSIDAI